MHRHAFVALRALSYVLCVFCVFSVLPRVARASCDLEEGREGQFVGTQGFLDRPFAGPGEPLAIALRDCDPASLPSGAELGNFALTVVFTPDAGGPVDLTQRSAVILTSDDCTGIDLAGCESEIGGSAVCLGAADSGLEVVDTADGREVRFRFPSTDRRCVGGADGGELCASDADCDGTCGPADGQTRAGAARIALVDRTSLGCGITSCADDAGSTTACVDELFTDTGSCEAIVPEKTFPTFTALPPPNRYAAECTDEAPPCPLVPVDGELRLALDAEGNALVPFQWDGIREEVDGEPAARLVTARFAPFPSPIVGEPPILPSSFPGPSFLTSHAPDGRVLAPVFRPQPGNGATLELFGSADAPYTILRAARRSDSFQACKNTGLPCNEDAECPGSKCDTAQCFDRTTNTSTGDKCVNDLGCPDPDEECGASLFNLAIVDFLTPGSPGLVAIPRQIPLQGICTNDPSATCASDGDCGGPEDECVIYDLRAGPAVPIEDLVPRDELADFTIIERVDGVDRNGDGDATDLVMTQRDQDTGELIPLGGTPGCGLDADALGRAVIRTSVPPLRLPAGATEGGLLAFVETESGQNACDLTGDGDIADGVLRVFDDDGNDLTAGVSLGVDAAPVIDGRSLAVSRGQIFFRSSEAQLAAITTERLNRNGLSEATGGASRNVQFQNTRIVFESDATNLDPVLPDSNGHRDIFMGLLSFPDPTGPVTMTRVSRLGPLEANGDSFRPSASGSTVGFESDASNLDELVLDTNGLRDVYMLTSQYTSRVNRQHDTGAQAQGGDSRNVVVLGPFTSVYESDATNLLGASGVDDNGVTDIYWSFIAPTNPVWTFRISVASNGDQANGASRNPPREKHLGLRVRERRDQPSRTSRGERQRRDRHLPPKPGTGDDGADQQGAERTPGERCFRTTSHQPADSLRLVRQRRQQPRARGHQWYPRRVRLRPDARDHGAGLRHDGRRTGPGRRLGEQGHLARRALRDLRQRRGRSGLGRYQRPTRSLPARSNHADDDSRESAQRRLGEPHRDSHGHLGHDR